MISDRSLCGVVLAGGYSRRMGRDKALLEVDGEPLWRRQLRVLREAGADPVAVALRSGQTPFDAAGLCPRPPEGARPRPSLRDSPCGLAISALSHSVVRSRSESLAPPVWLTDSVPSAGPLAGIHTALVKCPGDLLLVLAVDMPRIDAGWFRRLLAVCRPGVGAVARSDQGFEPLAAVYPAAALPIAAACLQSEDHSLQRFVLKLERASLVAPMPLPDSERWRMENWNEPAQVGTSVPLVRL